MMKLKRKDIIIPDSSYVVSAGESEARKYTVFYDNKEIINQVTHVVLIKGGELK